MAKDTFVNNNPEDSLESLLKILDDLYSYNIIREYKLNQVDEIMFGLHGLGEDSEEDEYHSISSIFDECDDKHSFIYDLRNAIRYVLHAPNYSLEGAISEIMSFRDQLP